MDINELRRKRFMFLKDLYESTQGSTNGLVNWREIGAELGFELEETERIREYLINEGLVKGFTAIHVRLTHEGVVQVERALAQPNEPTTYFPAVNMIYVERMENSQIQQASVGSSQTYGAVTDDLDKIREFVSQFRSQMSELGLDGDTRSGAEADLATIEAQVNAPKPKTSIIRESLTSLRSVLEGIAGNVIAGILLRLLTGGAG